MTSDRPKTNSTQVTDTETDDCDEDRRFPLLVDGRRGLGLRYVVTNIID